MRIKKTSFIVLFMGIFLISSHQSMGGSADDAALAATIAGITANQTNVLNRMFQAQVQGGLPVKAFLLNPIGVLTNLCAGVDPNQKPDLSATCKAVLAFLANIRNVFNAMVNAAGSGGVVGGPPLVEVDKFIAACNVELTKLLTPEFVASALRSRMVIPDFFCYVLAAPYNRQ